MLYRSVDDASLNFQLVQARRFPATGCHRLPMQRPLQICGGQQTDSAHFKKAEQEEQEEEEEQQEDVYDAEKLAKQDAEQQEEGSRSSRRGRRRTKTKAKNIKYMEEATRRKKKKSLEHLHGEPGHGARMVRKTATAPASNRLIT